MKGAPDQQGERRDQTTGGDPFTDVAAHRFVCDDREQAEALALHYGGTVETGAISNPRAPRGSVRYLKIFFQEKGIDPEQGFEVMSRGGTPNHMNYGVVVEAILAAPPHEQAGIADMLRRIDFQNGDVRHYLRHLAQALAQDMNPPWGERASGLTGREQAVMDTGRQLLRWSPRRAYGYAIREAQKPNVYDSGFWREVARYIASETGVTSRTLKNPHKRGPAHYARIVASLKKLPPRALMDLLTRTGAVDYLPRGFSGSSWEEFAEALWKAEEARENPGFLVPVLAAAGGFAAGVASRGFFKKPKTRRRSVKVVPPGAMIAPHRAAGKVVCRLCTIPHTPAQHRHHGVSSVTVAQAREFAPLRAPRRRAAPVAAPEEFTSAMLPPAPVEYESLAQFAAGQSMPARPTMEEQGLAGYLPGAMGNPWCRGSRNPPRGAPLKLPPSRVAGRISLQEAIRRNVPGIREAIARFRRFHGCDPSDEVTVYDDGRKDDVAAFIIGRAPEFAYDDVPQGSNKAGSPWIHKTSKKYPSYLVHAPLHEQTYVVGAMSVSDWLREKDEKRRSH